MTKNVVQDSYEVIYGRFCLIFCWKESEKFRRKGEHSSKSFPCQSTLVKLKMSRGSSKDSRGSLAPPSSPGGSATTFDVRNQFEDLQKPLATGSYYVQNVLDLADINTRLQSKK